jgi:hypothetical protein
MFRTEIVKKNGIRSLCPYFFTQILRFSMKIKQKKVNVSELLCYACTVPALEVHVWPSTHKSVNEADINVLTLCFLTHTTANCCVHVHICISNNIQIRMQLKKIISYVV